MTTQPLSSCCRAPVKLTFTTSTTVTYYTCTACGKPCSIDHPTASTGHGVEGETDTGSISDGYHTFDELYDHRITLYIALCKMAQNFKYIWRSLYHSDGSFFEGQFILGMDKGKGRQITYHVPIERWNETDFAQTLEIAPEFDGHTSTDVLERIKNL